jgi:hypothetical protein
VRAVKRAGLGAVERDGRVIEPAPTFHCLRHSHGSALIAAGWDIEEVSARLGHSHCGDDSANLRPRIRPGPAQRRSAGPPSGALRPSIESDDRLPSEASLDGRSSYGGRPCGHACSAGEGGLQAAWCRSRCQ